MPSIGGLLSRCFGGRSSESWNISDASQCKGTRNAAFANGSQLETATPNWNAFLNRAFIRVDGQAATNTVTSASMVAACAEVCSPCSVILFESSNNYELPLGDRASEQSTSSRVPNAICAFQVSFLRAKVAPMMPSHMPLDAPGPMCLAKSRKHVTSVDRLSCISS